MKRSVQVILIVSAAALLGACNFFSQPADLQTESLQNEVASTQIAAVRATATVNADRLMVTLEDAQTAVGNIDQQSTRIASTLIAQGMPFVDASAITPVVPTAEAQQPNNGGIPQIANPLLTPGAPQVNSQGSAQGDTQLIPVTPAGGVQPTVDANAPSLTDIALSEQVGSDDCAVNPTTSFSASATDIYVVGTAHHIQPDTSLTATFTRDGQTVTSYPWTPGFAIDGACVWFHMPASDVTFTPGNWQVALTINGASSGAPIPFSIFGDSPTQINVTPETGG